MSIQSEAFYMVPKELHQTDLSISELYLYSRMFDDFEYYTNKRNVPYAPSHEYLAALLQSNRAQTAANTVSKLEKKGLVIDTGSRHGGRKVYQVVNFKEIEGLITLPTFEERRAARREEKEARLTESVNLIEQGSLTESVNLNAENEGRLTESVNPTNAKREPNQRKALTRLTQSVDMSDDSHTLTKLKSNDNNDREDEKNDREKLRSHKVSYSIPSLSSPLSIPSNGAFVYKLDDIPNHLKVSFYKWDKANSDISKELSERIKSFLNEVVNNE